jgi:hypothetical protein
MREYRTIDKSEWGDGPWQQEPDKRQWTDEATGLPCLIVRSRLGGNLCGYVGVPPSHPAHGAAYGPKDYCHPTNLEAAIEAIPVHGGLTFAAGCGHGDESTSICHIPEPGEPDDVWWFGFDCAHYQDYSPGLAATIKRFSSPEWMKIRLLDESYRDVSFVENEIRVLAAGLAEMQRS